MKYAHLAAGAVAACAALLVCGAAHAAEPACALPGKVPALQVEASDASRVAPSLTMMSWSNQQLQLVDVRAVRGACRASVTGFAGNEIALRGNLVTGWTESGELSAARNARLLPDVPRVPEVQHDDHQHGAVDFGEFIGGARIAAGPGARPTEYFVGAWKPDKHPHAAGGDAAGSTIAVYARTPDGVFSGAAALLRSSLPLRGVSYTPGPDAESGLLGITQESGDELRLITLRWKHRDYAR